MRTALNGKVGGMKVRCNSSDHSTHTLLTCKPNRTTFALHCNWESITPITSTCTSDYMRNVMANKATASKIKNGKSSSVFSGLVEYRTYRTNSSLTMLMVVKTTRFLPENQHCRRRLKSKYESSMLLRFLLIMYSNAQCAKYD